MLNLPTLNNEDLLLLINNLPIGIFLVDKQKQIVWVNDTLCELVGLDRTQLIGHKRSELPGTNIFPISERVAKQHLDDPNSDTLFNFNYISKKLYDSFDNVCEIGCLAKLDGYPQNKVHIGFEPVEERTGLFTRAGIAKKLSVHVARSRRYFNPLSIILLRVLPQQTNQLEDVNQAIAGILKDKLRWVDDVGHWSQSDFLLILPETNEESANKLARKIKYQLARFRLPTTHNKIPTAISVTSWHKGEDDNTMIKRVLQQVDTNFRFHMENRLS